jgi:hypothetical protein
MARIYVVVLLVCFLLGSRANPVVPGNQDAAKTQESVVAAEEKQDQDVEEKLEVAGTVSKEEPIKDEIKAEMTKDEAKSSGEAQVASREARNLLGGNQANEIGGASHQMISETEDALLRKLNKKCSERDVSSCVMLKLVMYMNRLLKKSDIEVFEGLRITQTVSEERISEEAEPLENPRSSGDEDDETQLSQLMANKLWTFVRTRSLRWSVLPDADVVLGTSPDEDGELNLGMSFHTGKAIEKGEYGMLESQVARQFSCHIRYIHRGGCTSRNVFNTRRFVYHKCVLFEVVLVQMCSIRGCSIRNVLYSRLF